MTPILPSLPDHRADWLRAFQIGAIAERPACSPGIGMLDSGKLARLLSTREARRKQGVMRRLADRRPGTGWWFVAAALAWAGISVVTR